MDKETRKRITKIQKEINRLKKEVNKVELSPCHSDAELRSKDEGVSLLRKEIYELEKEVNQYALYVSGLRHEG